MMPHVREDKPVIIVERSSGGLGGFLIGLLMGAGAALLFAPQSGEETRRVLKDRSRQLRDDAQAKAEEWREQVGEGYGRARDRIDDGVQAARRGLRDTRDGAQDALDAGKAAVHSARDELERRLAESRSRGKGSPADDEAAE
jgi:gas vesicle protein